MDINDALRKADDANYSSEAEIILAAEVRRQRKEIEQLRTRAGVLLSGEPVAYRYQTVNCFGDVVWMSEMPNSKVLATMPLYLHPAPDSDTVRDAERYRWLRDNEDELPPRILRMVWDGGPDLDEAIDAVRGAK